jgi:hypothetical protein
MDDRFPGACLEESERGLWVAIQFGESVESVNREQF